MMGLRDELQIKEADVIALQESLESTITRITGHHGDMSAVLRESAVLRKEVSLTVFIIYHCDLK